MLLKCGKIIVGWITIHRQPLLEVFPYHQQVVLNEVFCFHFLILPRYRFNSPMFEVIIKQEELRTPQQNSIGNFIVRYAEKTCLTYINYRMLYIYFIHVFVAFR